MLTYLIILITLIVLGLIGLAWFLGGAPVYRRRVYDDLSKFFKTLLFSPYKTGFLVIQAPNKNRLVQFRRFQRGNQPALRFDFPLLPGSEHYHELLRRILHERGMDHETTTDQDSIDGSGSGLDESEGSRKACAFRCI